ncbi:MAG: hypothetical protein JWP19_1085 [Rhodoglobus sp.]|nr:hypothetical protein [Rhodoglobus sp.]
MPKIPVRRPLTKSEKVMLGIAGGILAVMALSSLANAKPSAQSIQLVAESSQQSEVTPTPKASVVVTGEETEVVSIPFDKQAIDDENYPAGTVQVTTVGVPGTKTVVYQVTKRDGLETSRTVLSETVTLAPVSEVTSRGTYVAPPPVAAAPSGCDPNYDGGCVPIASDVDCAGGSGNGPAYVSGPVYVVGSDIYGLDRDGDGVACG